MTLTDKILFCAGIIMFWRGWNKGILRTVFGPVALIVCSIISYCYYLITHDLMVSAAIGILAPIVLNIIFSIMLNLLSGKDHAPLSVVSRIIAAFLNLIWGEFILVVVILTALFIPFDVPPIVQFKADVQQSSMYALMKPTLDEIFKSNRIQPVDPAAMTMAALTDPKKMEALEKTPEFQSLINDPRIQELITDPALAKDLENKQIGALMKHPKFIELTRDPELLKKFLALYGKMTAQTSKTP